MKRSSLGAVCGALIATLEGDAISEECGFWPPPGASEARTLQAHGWTVEAIELELRRRGISQRWTYFSGLDMLLDQARCYRPTRRFRRPMGAR